MKILLRRGDFSPLNSSLVSPGNQEAAGMAGQWAPEGKRQVGASSRMGRLGFPPGQHQQRILHCPSFHQEKLLPGSQSPDSGHQLPG